MRSLWQRRAASLWVGAALWMMAGVAARASSNQVPDWVRAAAQQPLPKFEGDPKAVVLLDEQTYTVGADGRAVEHVRRVVKILRPQGRDYGYPAVSFDKDSKVLSMHVWSIDPAGHEYAMKDSEIVEYGDPGDGELYSDEKAKVATPPGRDPGGVVAWEYERRERPYVAETSWHFQDELPRMQQSFTLVLPQGYTYTTTWAHHDKVDGIDLENHHYRWEMNNEAGIDLERLPMSPGVGALAARMTVHYAGPGLAEPQDGTWQGVGEWYEGLSRDRLVATPEITAKAQELVAGKTDFYDKAEAIGSYVQKDIRYFVIELGVGGWQPHAAGDIFRGRYGDCKDKAALFVTMLSAVGIHGAMVLVDSDRGYIDPASPSHGADHMIAAVEIPQGYESAKLHSVVTLSSGRRYLIFDPTWALKAPFGQLENNLQGSYGLVLEGKDSQIVQLPVLPPELNKVTRTAAFELKADGSIQGKVTDVRYGDEAASRRYYLTAKDGKEQQEFMDRSLSRDLRAASMTDLRFENLDVPTRNLTTTYSLAVDHFASLTGPLLMVRPRVLGSYHMDVDRKPRKVQIDLEQTMQGADAFDIKIPEGYVVDELPDPVKVDLGFASYESSTVVRGSVLHYTRTYTLRAVTLPPGKYAEVQKLAAVIAADEDSKAVLKRKAAAGAE
jgi:hypothetical protein